MANSVAAAIRQRVSRIPKGQPFAISSITRKEPQSAVRKALAIMVRKGKLTRVLPGIFMRPELSRLFGEVPANAVEVVRVIARARNEKLQIHGSEAVRHFRLSTQMQLVPTYYTSGPTRTFQLGLSRVRLIHADPVLLQHAGTQVGAAISALHYLVDQEATKESLQAITHRLCPAELEQLLACRLPKWAEEMLSRSV